MYFGLWKLDDFLTFTVGTHNPATGAVADADSEPVYRIYEDETEIPILTGTMAKLDDTNTVGFYSERIQLTAVNGFEEGKTYTVRITATVAGVTGSTERSVQIGIESNVLGGVIELAGNGNPEVTLKEAIQLMLSFMLGLSTGGGTSTIVFRDINNTRNCVQMSVDSVANRLTVTRTTVP